MSRKFSASFYSRAPLKLWPRGRLDIGWPDLLFAALAPWLPGTPPKRVWPTSRPHLAVHSVRTAWDALLSIYDWPAGSEVVFSEANIPDMVRIIEAHGLIPVPVPLDPHTLQAETSAVLNVLTSRTKALLMSPLFGTHMELDELGALAREYGLLLVEDAAQAFRGVSYEGAPAANVSLFSFGLIKTRTTLSGGVVFAHEEELLKKLERYVHSYPRVSTKQFYVRGVRAVLLQLLSYPIAFGIVWRVLQNYGIDPDVWLSQATKGMAGSDLLTAVRKQPHRGTLKLLRRRLHDSNYASLHQRVKRGRESLEVLSVVLGQKEYASVFWALPVVLDERKAFIESARLAGFDVSFRASSLVCHVPKETPFSRSLGSAVFLPIGTSMPDSEWTRLLRLVKAWQPQRRSIDGRQGPVGECG